MEDSYDLTNIQNWMQAFIFDQNDSAPAKDRKNKFDFSNEKINQNFLPSEKLTPRERIEIYSGMYFLRFRDVLAGDYEAVLHFLGDDNFDKLTRGYIQKYPSRNYSLNPLGNYLPEYIKQDSSLPRRGFLHDLAQLELAMSHVFDEQESPTLTSDDIVSVPPGAWEKIKLTPVKAFRLLAFRYPVNAYLQSVRDMTPHPQVRRQDTWIAVYRKNYKVGRLSLTLPAYKLLQLLSTSVSLGESIQKNARLFSKHNTDQIFKWFSEWVSAGIFQSIEY